MGQKKKKEKLGRNEKETNKQTKKYRARQIQKKKNFIPKP